MQKFVGRNRIGVGAALTTLLALTTATGVAVSQKMEAVRQEQAAATERDRALAAVAHRDAVDAFMADLLLEAGRTGRPVSISNLISRAEVLSATEFAGNPDARAAVLKTVAEFELEFDGMEKALAKFKAAKQLLANSRDLGLRASVICGEALLSGLTSPAEQSRKVLIEVATDGNIPDASRSECYGNLAQLALWHFDGPTAMDASGKALDLWGKSDQQSPLRRLELLTYQAAALNLNGQPAKADQIYARVMADLHLLGRERGTLAADIGDRRIVAAISTGDLRKALALVDEAIALARQDFPDRPPPLRWLNERSRLLSDVGRYSEALAGFEVIGRIAPGEDRMNFRLMLLGRAVASSGLGRFDAAEKYYRQALELERNGQDSFGVGGALPRLHARAKLDLDQRRYDRARQTLTEALQIVGAENLALATTRYLRSLAELGADDISAAESDAGLALKLSEKLRGDEPFSAWVGLASFAEAQVASRRGDVALARKSYQVAVEQLANTVADVHPVLVQARLRLQQLRDAASSP